MAQRTHNWRNRSIDCNMKLTLKGTDAFKAITILFGDLPLGHWVWIANGLLDNTWFGLFLVAYHTKGHGNQV